MSRGPFLSGPVGTRVQAFVEVVNPRGDCFQLELRPLGLVQSAAIVPSQHREPLSR